VLACEKAATSVEIDPSSRNRRLAVINSRATTSVNFCRRNYLKVLLGIFFALTTFRTADADVAPSTRGHAVDAYYHRARVAAHTQRSVTAVHSIYQWSKRAYTDRLNPM
jgi:hypothetical protein